MASDSLKLPQMAFKWHLENPGGLRYFVESLLTKLSELDFHGFSIKFLLGSDHFGALAGRSSIFIDFQ